MVEENQAAAPAVFEKKKLMKPRGYENPYLITKEEDRDLDYWIKQWLRRNEREDRMRYSDIYTGPVPLILQPYERKK